MRTPTKPIFLMPGTAWDVEYDGSVEPDADTPVWSLEGVDHAASDGDVLTIENAGTDLCAYSRSLVGTSSAVWAFGRVAVAASMPAAVASLALHLQGKRARFHATDGDGGGVLLGLRDDASAEVHWKGGLLGAWTATNTTTDTKVSFGKQDATDSNLAQQWDFLAYIEGQGFATPWPPAKWIPLEGDPKDDIQVAYDGTEETIHGRVDLYGSFVIQALTDAQVEQLYAFWNAHAKGRQPFRIFRDVGALDTCDSLVVRWEKGFTPRGRGGGTYDVPVRFKVVT